MLSGPEILRRIKLGHSRKDSLTIVPLPDLQRLEARAEASIDLKLGRWFLALRQARIDRINLSGLTSERPQDEKLRDLGKEHFVPFGSEFILHPGRFVIGITLEWIRLPETAGGYVTGKSSLGRHGLVIETAAAIHPRFSGCLALEIANIGEVPLVLCPGMPVAQLLLHGVTGKSKAANSTFDGRRKPYLREPKADALMEALSQEVI